MHSIQRRPRIPSTGRILSAFLVVILLVLGINRVMTIENSGDEVIATACKHTTVQECKPCPDHPNNVRQEGAIDGAKAVVVDDMLKSDDDNNRIKSVSTREAKGELTKHYYEFVKKANVKEFLKEREEWTPEQWETEAIRLVQKNQLNKYTIIAAANIGHLNFTLNWIASLKLNQFDKFLIFCFDFQLYSMLVEYGFHENTVIAPLTWIKYEIPPKEHKWMEESYNKLTQGKLRIQYALLERNFWILFSDVDVVFCTPHVLDHVRYLIGNYCSETNDGQYEMAKHTQSICVLQTDASKSIIYQITGFTDFAYMYDQDTDINTGFFVARSTPTIKQVFKNTIEHMNRWGVDQLAFNYEIRTLMKIKYSKTFKGLDKLLYANGGIFEHENLNEKFNIKPMVVHANYAEGFEAKKKMLQKHGYWYIM